MREKRREGKSAREREVTKERELEGTQIEMKKEEN